ncbi:MAG: single-stranded-DNA-specific exonuclease RecJ [Chloroflexi bacterium HGW-Chloroflexi-1]|nr:MAG: single-stranded-DNA-specific exonuclease RecJ [Chloroflexi bacterium HGW-Chloroflexi-1]
MRAWSEPPEVTVPDALRAAVGGRPLVAEMLTRRGISEVAAAQAFLDPDHYTPAAPTDLPGMARAADRLERAIREDEPICVWGDFDVDGQTATTVLVTTLRDLAAAVTYHIPVRAAESHGVSLPVLQQIIDVGARLILTCDTGIAAHAAVDYARDRGVDVIVTDHHDLPSELPAAHAIVNPKLLPASHPLHELPGVGVAYKLAEELYDRASRPAATACLLDLVALGIVADVAVQTGDTRYLLQRGLAALRRTERLGLRVLMETADLNPAWLSEEHIGFVLGPRLNALGRLADANTAVEFLTTTDLIRARILATELEGLNARRKLLCDQVDGAVEAQLARDPALLDHAALVLSGVGWPAGVIGIVASRLVERYGRPTVLIAEPAASPLDRSALARGSARSVAGCNITAAIAAHAEMLAGYGGHPMAAGLSIAAERIPEFRRGLSRTVAAMLGEARWAPVLEVDGYLALGDLTLDLVDDLGRLAPFGPGNPPLTLATHNLRLENHRTVGRNDEHRLLVVADAEEVVQRVIWWDGASQPPPEGTFDLAYVVRASDYRGEREIQVEWVDARPSAGERAGELAPAAARGLAPQAKIEVIDHRGAPNPRAILADLVAQGAVAVWREGEAAAEIPGHDRQDLPRTETLVIWTAPPGPTELRAALAQVAPARVYLFGLDPGPSSPDAFLRRLAGLVRYALNTRGGRVHISDLAAATAQRTETIRAGIAWLAARGHIRLVSDAAADELQLAPGGSENTTDTSQIRARVQALLDETAAYRSYFRTANAAALMKLPQKTRATRTR